MKTTSNCTIIAMIMALGLLPFWADSQVTIGGVNLGNLPNYFMFYSDARADANWQGTSKGYIGNVAIDGIQAHEISAGTVAYSGTIYSNDSTLSGWQHIVDGSPGQAFSSLNNTMLISNLTTDLENAFTQINSLTVTAGYSGVSSTSLNGLNTQNGIAETYVINVTSGFTVSSKINITGDANDVFILRWDNDANFSDGYEGNVKFQSGGAIVPLGGLLASNFIHVAGNINSGSGGSNPPSPYPQGPRYSNGTGNLIGGGADWNGGGFFTGYWLTTGSPTNNPAGEQPYGDTHQLSNAIFVGGWYSKTTKFNMKSGTSGVYVSPPATCNISISATQVNVLCHGNSNGSIDVTVTGAQNTVAYLWNDGATTQDRTGLAAGTYTVTGTDAGNCTATLSTTISEPSSSINVSMSTTDESNGNGSDGTATANPSGGTPAYTFLWSTGATTQTITGLTAGTYTVTVTDFQGCTASNSSVVNQANCSLNLSPIHNDVLCYGGNNGSITITESGAHGTVGYVWNDGATTQDRTGLSAGTYTDTATDASNCIATVSATIIEPSSPISASILKTDVSTSGGSDGTATANPSGGTPGYTFQWSTGATTQTITGLAVGSYTVTVTDSHGCTASISITINQLNCSLNLSQIHNDVSCFDGNNSSITVTKSGAQGTVSYIWNDGATTQNRSGLSAGIYTVTGTDQGGCSASISLTIQQPSAPVTISIVKTEVTHMGGFDGTAIATASGGTPGYSYLWSTGATTSTISKRPAGTYTITVTDSHGCTASNTVTIFQPTCVFFCSEQHTDVSCYGGSDGTLIVGIHQFTGEVTYIWNDGATTKIRTGLPAGTYNVTATDGAGCIAYKTMYIHQPLSAVSVSMSNTDVTTNGGGDGTATVTASGGIPGYSYLWSNGATTSTITNLAAGTYSVTATDVNGCTAGSSIIVNQPANKEMGSGSGGASMNLYPNPAQDKFSMEITTNDNSEKEYRVVVENILSQIIYISQGQTLNGLAKDEISFYRSIPDGVYSVHIIIAGNEELNRQLLVQH